MRPSPFCLGCLCLAAGLLAAAPAPGLVEGIEIYRGLSTVPAQFLNSDAKCGVVAIWTRRGGTLSAR